MDDEVSVIIIRKYNKLTFRFRKIVNQRLLTITIWCIVPIVFNNEFIVVLVRFINSKWNLIMVALNKISIHPFDYHWVMQKRLDIIITSVIMSHYLNMKAHYMDLIRFSGKFGYCLHLKRGICPIQGYYQGSIEINFCIVFIIKFMWICIFHLCNVPIGIYVNYTVLGLGKFAIQMKGYLNLLESFQFKDEGEPF